MYPQYNPYTGETHFGIGAYAGPERPMIHMSGLGADSCNLSTFIDQNIWWLIGGIAAVVVLKGLNKHLL